MDQELLDRFCDECCGYLSFSPTLDFVSESRLSDWDLQMYAVFLFNDEDPAIHDPRGYLYTYEQTFRAIRFWSRSIDLFSPSEIGRIHDAVVKQLKLGTWTRELVSVLGSPASFRFDLESGGRSTPQSCEDN